nr:MAG TPA: hypothetical protein [Caudoviricetes sp.]
MKIQFLLISINLKSSAYIVISISFLFSLSTLYLWNISVIVSY